MSETVSGILVRGGFSRAGLGIALFAALALLTAASTVFSHELPWGMSRGTGTLSALALGLSILSVLFATPFAALWLIGDSTAIVKLDDWGVTQRLGGPRTGELASHPWSRIRSFDDGSSREVVLRVDPSATSPSLEVHIPTRDEATRTAVLACLAARGIPRSE